MDEPTQPAKRPPGFLPGNGKPEGSGRAPGTKNKATIMREQIVIDNDEEIRELSKQCQGLTAQQIFDKMEFNPLIASIFLAKAPTTSEKVRADVLKDLNAKYAANLKASEIKTTEIKRIEVHFVEPEPDPKPIQIEHQPTGFIPSLDMDAEVIRKKD